MVLVVIITLIDRLLNDWASVDKQDGIDGSRLSYLLNPAER
jgi:hypothetical protein